MHAKLLIASAVVCFLAAHADALQCVEITKCGKCIDTIDDSGDGCLWCEQLGGCRRLGLGCPGPSPCSDGGGGGNKLSPGTTAAVVITVFACSIYYCAACLVVIGAVAVGVAILRRRMSSATSPA
jgi:hypothetical protein